MSKRTSEALLTDIKESIIRIQQYVGVITYAEFIKDTKTQDAVVRNIGRSHSYRHPMKHSFQYCNI